MSRVGSRVARFLFAAAFILISQGLAWAQLPIKLNTPGKASKVTKQQVCTGDYASTVKPVKKWQADQAYAAYGLREDSGRMLVQVIPSSLGGTNDPENLWPLGESKDFGPTQKKAVDDKLHELVCAGTVELKAAQDALKQNWVEAYKKYVTP